MPEVDFSPDQEIAINQIEDWRARRVKEYFACGGLAGTGKSTIAAWLVGNWGQTAVCALCGKAANVLRQKGVNAQTVHSLIYCPFEDERTGKVRYRKRKYLEGVSQIVVDEASMIDHLLMQDLLSFGLPVLFIGDHGQLEPIGTNPGIMKSPDVRLEKIHRQAAGNPILRLAAALREGRPVPYWQSADGALRIVPKAQFWREIKPGVQIICGFNKTRHEVNRRVRKILGFDPDMPCDGDRLICLQNNQTYDVFNGQQFTVKAVWGGTRYAVDLELEDESGRSRVMPCLRRQFAVDPIKDWKDKGVCLFDYGCAVTCHKCVHPETLVETMEGLLPIKSIAPEGYVSVPDGGGRPYDGFVKNPLSAAMKIRTEDNYEITVTPEHRCEVWVDGVPKMALGEDVQPGHWVRLKLGMEVDAVRGGTLPPKPESDVRSVKHRFPETVDESFAEFAGLMVADGTVFKSGFRLVKRHPEVGERFGFLCRLLFGANARPVSHRNATGYEVSSREIADWLRIVGGMSPNQKGIPDCIMRSPEKMQRKFLRGLFEDGFVNVKEGKLDHVGWTTCNQHMVEKVRVMLLRAGIVSNVIEVARGNFTVFVYGEYAADLGRKIGFITKMKQDRTSLPHGSQTRYRIPVNHADVQNCRVDFVSAVGVSAYQNALFRGYVSRGTAKSLAASGILGMASKLGWHFSRVSEVEKTECESMCINVPEGHRFLQNRMPFWNSQGSEYESVLVLDEVASAWDGRRWRYTAATRAKEQLTFCL